MAYDAGKAFERIENELIDSMIRNLKRHLEEEEKEGFDWSQWQVEQLKYLEQFRKQNRKKYGRRFSSINAKIRQVIREAKQNGQKAEELNILQSLVQNKSLQRRKAEETAIQGAGDAFFRINDHKLNSLLSTTQNDLQRAEYAVLRRADDQYRRIIFDAQMYANTGAGTVQQAVDMATKDFLSKGIDAIVYKNGSRHTISDYADMYIRTAERRAYLMGEGQKRQAWGEQLVIVNRRGTMTNGNFGHACPLCIPWLGKILIDDVYSGGKPDGKHKLLSVAMAAGFLHPRCKDGFTTYFPGISSTPDPVTRAEAEEAVEAEKAENREKYVQRQAEKYDRLARYSLDPENKRKYEARAQEWKQQIEPEKSIAKNIRKYVIKSSFEDITDNWFPDAVPNSHAVTDLTEYTVDGTVYKVDGKHVVLDYSEREKAVAELLKREIGGEIYMVPRVNDPPKISTPDYLFNGKAYDLKNVSGKSKNALYNAVAKKKRQSPNFIFDVSESPLSMDEIEEQVGRLYASKHTAFIDEIVLIRDNKIVKVFKRK